MLINNILTTVLNVSIMHKYFVNIKCSGFFIDQWVFLLADQFWSISDIGSDETEAVLKNASVLICVATQLVHWCHCGLLQQPDWSHKKRLLQSGFCSMGASEYLWVW